MVSKNIIVPKTYAEWVEILQVLKEKENDEEIITVMNQGIIDWQSGVAERFVKKFIDSINYRMNSASDRFQKEMQRAYGRERDIINAILSLRKEINFLFKVIDIPAIPEEERKKYHDLFFNQVNKMQNSLEESAKQDRSGKFSNIVKNHRINTISKE
ncbi:MAG: hypothetical protein Q4A47_04970 [Erysipelotrichaceae bacterium]|nr:hypothetical protein [Erysipelotrichaceae bacterium]